MDHFPSRVWKRSQKFPHSFLYLELEAEWNLPSFIICSLSLFEGRKENHSYPVGPKDQI